MSFGINNNANDNLKAQWDALRGAGYTLDYERAVFLYNLLVDYLHENVNTLKKYMVVELQEYAGKRVESFVRMVHALDVDDNQEHWEKLGGKGMVLYTRVDGRRRGRVMQRVNASLKRTGRQCISEQTLRNILREVLGPETYRDLLTESRDDLHPRLNYRAQCVIYQQAILDLVGSGVIDKKQLPRELRTLLYPLDGLSGAA